MQVKRIWAVVFACLLVALSAAGVWSQEPVKDQAICYTTWDESYLYIAFKVDCPDVRGKQTAPNADVAGDDSVSVFVETDNKHSDTPTPRCFSMTVSAGAGSQFRAGTDAGSLDPKPVWTFKYGTNVQGTLNNSDDVDMGYTAEIALPWELLGMKCPKMGDMISFNVLIRRHGEADGSFVSLAPRVTTEAETLQPSKWVNLLFVSYSLGAVMQGGEKVLCPKSIVRPPLINGIVDSREWSKNSAFAIDLPMKEGFVYEAKYPIQKLVLARYVYSYQRDPRRQAEYTKLAARDGGLALQDFPAKNPGPWFSADRVQWHKEELADMASCGIDVVLPEYRGDRASQAAYGASGLDRLVSALAELKSEGKQYPLVGMLFDTSSIETAYGGKKPDLKDDEAKRAFYGMVKSFFDRIPAEFRAWAQTGKPDAGERAAVVFLAGPVSPDADTLAYANEQFQRDFASRLIWIASPECEGTQGCDGFAVASAADGSSYNDAGRIRIASLGPGYDDCVLADAGSGVIRSRMGGKTYEDEWAMVAEKQPHWIVCDGWNDFANGSALCVTREYGRKYIDATRAQVAKFRNGKEFDVQFVRYDVARVIPPKQFSMSELVIRNAGTSPWRVADGYALGYRWYKSGRFFGESKVRRPLERDVAPGETIALALGIATVDAQGAGLPDGDCELRIELIRQSDGKWFSALGGQALIVPITVGAAPEWKASWLSCGVPVMMESGQDYNVTVRVRNDGSRTWPKGQMKLGCRLYKVSNYTHDSADAISEEVPIKSVRILLEKDCKPGEIADIRFPLNLVQPDKNPLGVWNADSGWSYQLRLDLYNGKNWLSEAGSAPLNRVIEILEGDYGPSVVDSNVPAKLTAGQTFEAKVVIRNNGVHPWDRRRTGVGCHWYHLDGLELQWECEPTMLPSNVQPGWPAVVNAKLKAPEYDGQYVLVWDVNIDGQWCSTLPITRGGDILPVFVEVTGGRLVFADLKPLCDVSAISPDTNRTLADFDGKGSSFPSEYMPPDAGVTDAVCQVYPSGYKWDLESRPDGRISFLYPEKSPDAKDAVACNGQKVTTEHGRYVAVHILGASSAGDATGTVSLNYSNGAESSDLAMSDWGSGPKHGEKVALAVRHRHTHGGDEAGKRCYLYHYTLKLDPNRTLTSITLPKNAKMKVVAVTFERAGGITP